MVGKRCFFDFVSYLLVSAFQDTIFSQFPYLLPNIVTSVCVLVGLIVAFFYLFDPKSKLAKRAKISAVFTNRNALMTTITYGVGSF